MPRGAFDLYLRLASAIERQAREHAVPIVCVHESWRIDQVVADVEGWFAAEIDSGPRAKTAAELRTLLREANVSVEAQVRAYFARPWATEWPSRLSAFVCECGEPSCEAIVELAVGSLSDEPVVAIGHGYVNR